MKIEFDRQFIRDMISTLGVNHAISEMTLSFQALLDTVIEEIEKEVQEEIKARRDR
jgi:hypothetical protein